VLALVSVVVAAGMPVHADFSYLLPPSAKSVRQLRSIEQRTQVIGTVMVAIEAPDPVVRARAADALRPRLEALPKDLVASVTYDDGPQRRFGWDNRYLFASLEDLRQAKEVLARKIANAKVRANPLYVDLETEEEKPPDDDDAARRLRVRMDEAEQHKNTPSPFVSKDGTLQLVVVRTTFVSGDVGRGRALLAAANDAVRRTETEVGSGVGIGLTGDVVTTVAEQRSILSGMLIATVLTVVVVFGGLLLYYRSLRAVGSLLWALTVGALATFGFTRLAIGHLNIATAFLSSIVIGNGINFGIVLLARYLEERRRGLDGVAVVAAAVAGTARGTLAAALTAAVAYASLTVTTFRGFRDFGVIGGVGMILCWIAAYTVLPAALSVLERRRVPVRREPALGRALAWLMPRRLDRAAYAGLIVAVVAGVGAWHYLRSWPLEVNFRNLRSSSAEIREARQWLAKIDRAFGRGISGGFVIALPDRDVTQKVAARLRAADEGKPDKERLFARTTTLDDLLPTDQPEKLALLRDIRRLLDDRAIRELADDDRQEALRLRPPADLVELGPNDLPPELAWPFTERDGTRGRLILASAGPGYDVWNAHDLVRWTQQVSGLDLGDGALIGGSMFVFADVLRSVEEDGPRATLAAIIGSILAVALVVGLGRHGAVTLICGATGTLLMLAAASLFGLKVNFLDFVALPITIGIGIDYSVNIVVRGQQEGPDRSRAALAATGGAVVLCSFTTIVGYGSLLLSQNQGIRSFGDAAILGEITCLASAIVLAPALLHVFSRRR